MDTTRDYIENYDVSLKLKVADDVIGDLILDDVIGATWEYNRQDHVPTTSNDQTVDECSTVHGLSYALHTEEIRQYNQPASFNTTILKAIITSP
jgi:hypothetical protein